MGVYELKTRSRGARPRSKRLRELGVSGAAASGGTIVNVYGGSNAIGDSHYHENKRALDQITTDADGYQYLTRLQEATGAEGNEAYTEITEKVKAGFADVAHDLTENSPARELFLSRLADDVAKGNITFEKMVTALGLAIFKDGAAFGEFASSLYAGIGANIDAQGNAEFESVRVRSYFECLELIINRLSAIEGDQILTEGDTIERVEDLGDGRYGLHLKSKWDGYFTAQSVNNVLKGIINTMATGNGLFYTSWMRVNSVDTATNYIEVTLYPDADTPAGKNYPPCELMKIARWGNQVDEARQNCIYLSSTEGRIVHLTGVTKPIIDASNYGATFGTLPDFLREMDLPVIAHQDYIYARGLVVQDIIRVDYQGNPVSEIVYRGKWSPSETYYCRERNPQTGVYEISDVWFNGCRYRCARPSTTSMPLYNNTAWALIEGDPNMYLEVTPAAIVSTKDTLSQQVVVRVVKQNQTVTSYSDTRFRWTRTTELQGGATEASAADDANWSSGKNGPVINLTADDVYNGEGVVVKTRYEVTLNVFEEGRTYTAYTDVTFVESGGDTARDFQETRYAVNTSPTTAPTIDQSARIPAGWLLAPTGVSTGKYVWMTTAQISGTTDTLLTPWSAPVRTTAYDGKDGNFTEYRFAVNTSPTEEPVLNRSAREPSGWSTTQPSVATGEYLWMTSTMIIGATGQLAAAWGSPVRITPYDGKDGADGSAGSRGPTLRGPRQWSDLSAGMKLYSGADGEPYIDVVVHNGYYYYCKKSHNYYYYYEPGSTRGDEVWQLGDKLALVASRILLSEYALIDNLGVGAIEMKDADGNVIFEAKDGNVTCQTGTFNNVNVQTGQVAGFSIEGNGLINTGFDNDAYIIIRHDDQKAFAGIGGNVLSAVMGYRAVARFTNLCDTDKSATAVNYGAVIAAQGARTNVAMLIDGGCVQGYAMSNKVISAATLLDRKVSNVICLGSAEYTVGLPAMKLHDDGHVIRFKSLSSAAVKIKASTCETVNGTSTRTSTPLIIYDRSAYITPGNTISLASTSEAMELVWVRDVVTTLNGTTYYGAWVQYKFPRDW